MVDWKMLPFNLRFLDSLEPQETGDTSECEESPVLFPDDDGPVTVMVSLNMTQFTKIFSSLYKGAFLSYPDEYVSILNLFMSFWNGCNMACCDDILERLGELESAIEEISDVQGQNIASDVSPTPGGTLSQDCGAATAVVKAMHAKNLIVYQAVEANPVDTVLELLPYVIPVLVSIFGSVASGAATLPFDALFAIVEQHFEHQVEDYISDYNSAQTLMISDLACRIEVAGHQFNYDMWADWLSGLEVLIPDNAAASLFSRYSPFRITLLNQIAALLNRSQSIEAYFSELTIAYQGGQQVGSDACESCEWAYSLDEGSIPAWFTVDRGTLVSNLLISDPVTEGGFDFYSIALQVVFPSPTIMTHVLIHQVAGVAVGAGVINHFITYWDIDDNVIATISIDPQDGEWSLDFNDMVANVSKIDIQYAFITPPATGSEWDLVELQGIGIDPFA